MTKAELIGEVAERTEQRRQNVAEVIDELLECIKSALQKGDKVQLIPFGSFEVRERKKREGRNPKTGEKLIIPAGRVPAFRAGKDLRAAVQTKRRGK
ncbi:MAG: HU family DNA-binding protein [Candidatus Eremiobacteraeota bacterium]|nr:HU family DNA-binding protein [Candidatus Eremiobacteraeota bacterium]MBC5827848.1 HU family DNA-binding protein [Candidatus Eremiobacteraeota bacterium]